MGDEEADVVVDAAEVGSDFESDLEDAAEEEEGEEDMGASDAKEEEEEDAEIEEVVYEPDFAEAWENATDVTVTRMSLFFSFLSSRIIFSVSSPAHFLFYACNLLPSSSLARSSLARRVLACIGRAVACTPYIGIQFYLVTLGVVARLTFSFLARDGMAHLIPLLTPLTWHADERQTMVFSATLTLEVDKLVWRKDTRHGSQSTLGKCSLCLPYPFSHAVGGCYRILAGRFAVS